MYLAVFPQKAEYEKMRIRLDALGLSYTVITPEPAYSLVGCPAIAMEQESRSRLASSPSGEFMASGWVDYRPAGTEIPDRRPPCYSEDIFGIASIMMLAPCVANQAKIRLIAHISGGLTDVLPYLNAVMKDACYNHDGPSLTFMNGQRMMTLYPQRIAIAKVDDLVDGWRVLEMIRCRVNEIHARRASIEPLCLKRDKPPAMDIYKRLPGTNCSRCGYKTCMAFAVSLWCGDADPRLCRPIFDDEYVHLRDGLREITARLGFTAEDGFSALP